MSQSIRNAT
jgi:hypothetical protein